MSKKTIKIYLEPEDQNRLLAKAREAGFSGRGCLSKFLEKLAREDICFLDTNLKKMLKALNSD